MTNYLITVPIYHSKAEEIGDALIKNVMTKYCVPECISWIKTVHLCHHMNYLFNKLDINIKTVASYNHQSIQAKHAIKSLSMILTKHLTNLGQMWPKYLSLATFVYNTFNTPNLVNFNPYELVFRRKPKVLLNLETTPDIKVAGTFKDYHELLNKRIKYLHELL